MRTHIDVENIKVKVRITFGIMVTYTTAFD